MRISGIKYEDIPKYRYGMMGPEDVINILISSSIALTVLILYIRISNRKIDTSAYERLRASNDEQLMRRSESIIAEEIKNAVNKIQAESSSEIVAAVAEKTNEFIDKNIVDLLGPAISRQTDDLAQREKLRELSKLNFERMRNRSLEYADKAQGQATLFRYLAIILTLSGPAALIYLFRDGKELVPSLAELSDKKFDIYTLLLHNGPVTTIILLSEFLALLMFRYQSKAMEMMRHFSNEASNMDARSLAFETALYVNDDKKRLGDFADMLMRMERNFLIDKNQRTLEMANNELEDRLFDRLANAFLTQPHAMRDDHSHPADHTFDQPMPQPPKANGAARSRTSRAKAAPKDQPPPAA